MIRYRRRSAEEWIALFDEHSRSGLSIQAFCTERKIGYSTFSRWKARLSTNGSTNPVANQFIELSAPVGLSDARWDVELSFGEDIVLRLSRH